MELNDNNKIFNKYTGFHINVKNIIIEINGEKEYILYIRIMNNIRSYSSFKVGKTILSPQPLLAYEMHLVIALQKNRVWKRKTQ